VNALFVNSGILGQQTFARFVDRAFVGFQQGLRGTQIVLAERLTPGERALRRLLCLPLWPPGAGGLKNLDLLRFRAELHAGLLARRRIRQLERAGQRFDVLHFHRQATAYASLGRMRTTPSIVSIDCTQRPVLGQAAHRVEAASYAPNVRRDGEIFRAARLIVSTSRWAAACVRKEYPDCTTEIAVMPDPVQLDAFDPEWIEARRARAQTPGYRPRVLFMGGDFQRKGGHDLLSCWRDAAMGERAALDIVTAAPIAPDRLAPGVTVHLGVTAHSASWRALWRAADLFVLPTRDEAFGLVFQEAAAAGLAAIGTTINAVPEIVDDGRSGFLVPPACREALATALERLIASAELRHEMGSRARQTIVRTADPDEYRHTLREAMFRVTKR
jgi:glycosyltransferase involved in cell wall biosynthesis